MAMRGADEVSRHKAVQAAHVLAAALVAIAIAIVSQGWPSADGVCEGPGGCVATDAGVTADPGGLFGLADGPAPAGVSDDRRAL
jgi:hypothetical protein